ncbi:MAG: hypothetical protein Q9171_002306 [Xanthocarpia ochracea]
MGGSISRILSGLWSKKEIRILILGLDNAGKTTLLYRLKIGEVVTTIPTIGFNVESVTYKNLNFNVWDLGGQTSIRPYWRCYYANTAAVIFVIDSTDIDRLGTASEELAAMLNEDELRDAALLVFANKQDQQGARGAGDISEALHLGELRDRNWSIVACSAVDGKGVEEGMDWLVLRRSTRIAQRSKKTPERIIMPKAAATIATTAATKKGKSTTSKTKAKEAPPAKSIFPNLPGRVSTPPSAGELSKKRKTTDAADKTATKAPPAKRSKTDGDGDKKQPSKLGKAAVSPKAAAKAAPKARSKTVINEAPNSPLHVYVFGEGSSGELGLGDAKNAIDVKRPRLNAHLPADKVGVVHVACGGMHVAALTRDGKVLTWGVNDQGALGRDTQWEGGLRDMDADSDDEDNTGLNPRESTPGPITTFPEGTVIVKLSAGDSHTLALTDDGNVFGWGTFRSNEGILGFSKDTLVQPTPVLLPKLSKIVDIASGNNHALALDSKGVVYTWGSGQQMQLGYRMMERMRHDSLTPALLRSRGKNIRYIACGADHSFAIDSKEQVWSWGVNSFGGTGIFENAGEDNAVIISPTVVQNLKFDNDTITHIAGGSHHSLCSTEKGKCLIWGRFDGSQTGLDLSTVPEDHIVRDARGQARILMRPTQVTGIKDCVFVAAGTDHSLAITEHGKAYSWGFNANYQCGQGTTDDITVPTLIDNTATRDKKLDWAGAGGQYSILTAPVYDIDPVSDKPDNGEGASNAQGAMMTGALPQRSRNDSEH